MAQIIAPLALHREDPDILAVAWNDGTESRYRLKTLRCACPCAVCVNEWTGEKMLDDAKVPGDIRPAKLFSVGRYAMGVHWSDGHKTGIYSYEYLKKLEPGSRIKGG